MTSTEPTSISIRVLPDPVTAVLVGRVVVVRGNVDVVVVVELVVDVVVTTTGGRCSTVDVVVEGIVVVDVVVVLSGTDVDVVTGSVVVVVGPPLATVVVVVESATVVLVVDVVVDVGTVVLVPGVDVLVVDVLDDIGTVVDDATVVLVPGVDVLDGVVLVVDVLDGVVLLGGVVVVVDGFVPVQTPDRTNFTPRSVAGRTSANEPAADRSSTSNPSGTRTNTLSYWPALRISADPPKVNSVPSTTSEMEWNRNEPSLGARTKCQAAPTSGQPDCEPARSLCSGISWPLP